MCRYRDAGQRQLGLAQAGGGSRIDAKMILDVVLMVIGGGRSKEIRSRVRCLICRVWHKRRVGEDNTNANILIVMIGMTADHASWTSTMLS